MNPFITIYRHWSNRYDPECNRGFVNAWWHILLYAAAVIVLCAIIYTVWSLWGVRQASVPDTLTGSPPETLSRESLRETLHIFQQRQIEFDLLTENPPQIIDPGR